MLRRVDRRVRLRLELDFLGLILDAECATRGVNVGLNVRPLE